MDLDEEVADLVDAASKLREELKRAEAESQATQDTGEAVNEKLEQVRATKTKLAEAQDRIGAAVAKRQRRS